VQGAGWRGAASDSSEDEPHDSRDVSDHIDERAAGQACVAGHDVSKPRVIVRSWKAERIGPRIIAAPQRGHVHVRAGVVSTAVDVIVTFARAAAEEGAGEGNA
jgi:hypothetical protein